MSGPEKANSTGECGCSSKAMAAPGPDETKAACCGGGHGAHGHLLMSTTIIPSPEMERSWIRSAG